MSLKISRKLFWSYSNEKWENISEHFDLKTRKTGKRSCMVYCRFVYVLLIDIFRLLWWGKRSPEKDKNEYIWWDEILWFFFFHCFYQSNHPLCVMWWQNEEPEVLVVWALSRGLCRVSSCCSDVFSHLLPVWVFRALLWW